MPGSRKAGILQGLCKQSRQSREHVRSNSRSLVRTSKNSIGMLMRDDYAVCQKELAVLRALMELDVVWRIACVAVPWLLVLDQS